MRRFFAREWIEKPFTIPVERESRARLLARMQRAHGSDAARLPEHAAAKRVLLARIIALRSYDSVPT